MDHGETTISPAAELQSCLDLAQMGRSVLRPYEKKRLKEPASLLRRAGRRRLLQRQIEEKSRRTRRLALRYIRRKSPRETDLKIGHYTEKPKTQTNTRRRREGGASGRGGRGLCGRERIARSVFLRREIRGSGTRGCSRSAAWDA